MKICPLLQSHSSEWRLALWRLSFQAFLNVCIDAFYKYVCVKYITKKLYKCLWVDISLYLCKYIWFPIYNSRSSSKLPSKTPPTSSALTFMLLALIPIFFNLHILYTKIQRTLWQRRLQWRVGWGRHRGARTKGFLGRYFQCLTYSVSHV